MNCDIELVDGVPTAMRDIEPDETVTMPIEALLELHRQEKQDEPS